MVLSIIIPVYNVEAYVGRTLESVFDTMASVDDFEVIVVNDGTKDGSMDVVRQYADRPNIAIVEQENQGLSAARMNGLAVAKGEYVWFIDSDDWLVEDGVGKVLRLLEEREGAEVLMFPIIKLNGEESRWDYRIERVRQMDGKEIVRDPELPIWTAVRYVLKRSVMENRWVYFPDKLIHEDDYFGIALLCLSEKVQVMPEPVYVHVSRPGSIMNSLSRRSFYDLVSINRLQKRFMREVLDPSDWTWFQGFTFNQLMYGFDRFQYPGICRKGPYLWRAWRDVHPGASGKTQAKRFLYFLMPERFGRFRG